MEQGEARSQQQQKHSSRWRSALNATAAAAAALPGTIYGAAVHVNHVAQHCVLNVAVEKASQISAQFGRAPKHVVAGHLNEVHHAASFNIDAILKGLGLRWVLCIEASVQVTHQTLGSAGQICRPEHAALNACSSCSAQTVPRHSCVFSENMLQQA
jgi:hypothetical protein